MDATLKRNQVFPLVGVTDSVIIGSNPNRKKILISAPVPPFPIAAPNNKTIHNASSAATGIVLTYTVPAGKTALLRSAAYFATAGATQVLALQITTGGATVTVISGTVNQIWTGQMELAAGDVVAWNVTTLLAASTVDAAIFVEEYAALPRITLNFAGPAILDNGLNLYPGTLPLVLIDDDPGRAFHEEIHAISSLAGQQISVLDLFGP